MSARANNKIQKVVLISESGYAQKYDPMLVSFLEQGIELFCVVGKDCELWEEIMDELAVADGKNSRFLTTTSHPNNSINDVVEFAKAFSTSVVSEVELIRV